MPFEGYDHFGAHAAGETVGEELLHGKAVLDITALGEVIDKFCESFRASRNYLMTQIEVLVGMTKTTRLREIVGGQTEPVTIDLLRCRYGCGFRTSKQSLDDSTLAQLEGLDIVGI